MRYLLILLLFACSSTNLTKVTYIIDGDTFVTSTGKHIRLAEIDAPEHDQMYGEQSKAALKAYIMHKRVELKEITVDNYGRSICEVYYKGQWINKLMVTNGFAWAYSPSTTLLPDQERAQQQRIGLWQYPAENPYLFRKHNQ